MDANQQIRVRFECHTGQADFFLDFASGDVDLHTARRSGAPVEPIDDAIAVSVALTTVLVDTRTANGFGALIPAVGDAAGRQSDSPECSAPGMPNECASVQTVPNMDGKLRFWLTSEQHV